MYFISSTNIKKREAKSITVKVFMYAFLKEFFKFLRIFSVPQMLKLCLPQARNFSNFKQHRSSLVCWKYLEQPPMQPGEVKVRHWATADWAKCVKRVPLRPSAFIGKGKRGQTRQRQRNAFSFQGEAFLKVEPGGRRPWRLRRGTGTFVLPVGGPVSGLR